MFVGPHYLYVKWGQCLCLGIYAPIYIYKNYHYNEKTSLINFDAK